MKTFLFYILLMFATSSHAQGLEGSWKGKLNAGLQELTMVLNIYSDQMVSLDIPEQGAIGLAMKVNAFTKDSLSVEMTQLNLTYTGKLKEGKICGTFHQNFFTTSLDFEKTDEVVKLNRPQEPHPPFPYPTEEVLFNNYPAHVTLAGTLTLPTDYEEGKKVPVVLMVSGSGQQNRNEEAFGHKPFLVIADWLARNGIASLRYDDRGTGSSTGDYRTCTTRDFYTDARAGLDYLKTRHEFSKIGLLGHSEGGLIGYMLGSEQLMDFLVSLAGPACKIDTLMMTQVNMLGRSQGLNYDMVKNTYEARLYLNHQLGESAWLDYFLSIDMKEYVEKNVCPVLALGGENDCNVPISLNVPALNKYLPKNEKNIIKTYPELNHMFQHCTSGNPLLIGTIEETISEEVLKDIVDFINMIEK